MKNLKFTSFKEHNYSIPIIIFRIISVIIIVIALYFLYKWNLENKANNKIIDELTSQVNIPEVPNPTKDKTDNNIDEVNNIPNENTNIEENTSNSQNENYLLDFSNLLNTNSDTVAWIKINNTKVDFPVVKSQDNNYYLKHNFNKEYNSAGWIFADYRNKFDGTDKNIIIYGHNRRNGSMFSSLNNALEKSWYSNEENQYITLYTPQTTYKYQIFSIYKIPSSEFDSTTEFQSDEQFQNFINSSLEKSVYDFNMEITPADNILTVYTCANNNQYRIIIQAKSIKY